MGPLCPTICYQLRTAVLLKKVQMAPRIKIFISLGPRQEPRYTVFFFLKKSQKANPLQVAQLGPYRERYLLAAHFYISLIVFLSQSLVREPPPYSLTGSPRTRIIRRHSHWPSDGILFIHSVACVQVCTRVCVRARVCACMCSHACVCARARECVRA